MSGSISLEMKKFCVYSHYNGDELLYIGKGNWTRAFSPRCHNDQKEYHQYLQTIETLRIEIIQWFDSEDDAFRCESILIRQLKPRFNVAGVLKHCLQLRFKEIGESKVEAYLSKTNLNRSTIGYLEARNRLMVSLLYYTTMMVCDIALVTRRDFQKNGRFHDLNPVLMKNYKYLIGYRSAGSHLLFKDKNGGDVKEDSLRRAVARALDEI